MKFTRWFPIVVALSLPAAALADDTKERSEKTSQTSSEKSMKSSEHASRVKAHVVPVVAGIEAADKAAAALYELAGGESLQRKEAKSTVQLANQGIQIALTRSKALEGMKGLSADARAEAETTTKKLQEARSKVQQLDKKVGTRIQRDDMEQIREHAQNLHDDLSEAENAIERVAKAYDVSTDLELGG